MASQIHGIQDPAKSLFLASSQVSKSRDVCLEYFDKFQASLLHFLAFVKFKNNITQWFRL